jgi:branched-chain amino acid transport system substrate-binding protein
MRDRPPESGSGAVPASETSADVVVGESATQGSVTRGFLFADLRDYTRFVESHGAATAADLLARYRSLVRAAVSRHRGAEVKTEGDSFYVVFTSVSAAVQCGLAIAAEAGSGSPVADGTRHEPIAVGIGIHAGETIETPEGYVGGPVNIAARICALARPGDVLVSDTVRALTATVLPVIFTPLGRRQLKGVKESLLLYRVAAADPAALARASSRRRRALAARVAALAAVLVLLAVGAWGLFLRPAPAVGLPPGAWTIGVLVPLSGDSRTFGDGLRTAVQLALDDANANAALGAATLVLDVRDEGAPDEENATLDAVQAWSADPRVIAVVGPALSDHARAAIPSLNEGGLLACSPAATDAALTKPALGAAGLRSAFPDRISFVRLATSDDVEARAAASFIFNDLQVRVVLAVDDASDSSRALADSVTESFDALQPYLAAAGRSSYRRTLNPGATDFAAVYAPVHKEGTNPGALGRPAAAVYYAGDPKSGAADLKSALDAALLVDHVPKFPFVGWHGLLDGSGAVSGSFIERAGASADNSYATALSIAQPKADFDLRYRTAFGKPPGEYSGAAHACAQVIVEALADAASRSVDASQLREAVRSHVVDPGRRFETTIGAIGFDANGDSIHQLVSFFKVDVSALGGLGDWVLVKQQDFGATEGASPSGTSRPSPSPT